MMNSIRMRIWGSLLVGFLGINGCTTYHDPVRVEQDYGNSVRNMIQAQTYNPAAALNPSAVPPKGMDAPKAGAVLETYRSDVSKPQKVEQPILLNITR